MLPSVDFSLCSVPSARSLISLPTASFVDLPSHGSLNIVSSRPLHMDTPSCQVEGPPPGVVAECPPMILQVSPLPSSSNREEYFYNPSADVDHGSFAAAQDFFLAQGHTVTIHDCANLAKFQASYPSASICPILDVPSSLISQGQAILQAQLASFASLAEASGRSFLDRYADDASSWAAYQCTTASWGGDPPPVGLPSSLANATHGSCSTLPVIPEFGCSCHPPPPTASRRPDLVGVNAKSLSSHARVPSSGGYSHPDSSSTRGFPHPIPYGGVSYHPFTPFNCGGHKHHIPFNGGDIPFPVPHSVQHGGELLLHWVVTFHRLASLLSSLAEQLSLGTTALGGIPMRLHWWRLPLVLRVCRCVLCRIRMPRLCWFPTSPSPLVFRVSP
jgi:hypothetical protein